MINDELVEEIEIEKLNKTFSDNFELFFKKLNEIKLNIVNLKKRQSQILKIICNQKK